MKKFTLIVLLTGLTAASARDAVLQALPKSEDVFVIACHSQPREIAPYFTADSLLKSLREFRKGAPEIKVGAKRIWQSGVIVLKDASVLFWSTCRTNFIQLATPDGTISFIQGDGKDNL